MPLFSRSTKSSLQSGPKDDSKDRNDALAYTVLLTGSTGNFGCYLLHYLLFQPWVNNIILLNRSSDASSKQTRFSTSRGLLSTSPHKTITFHQADFSRPRLGLSDTIYADLASTVDIVIHNAWPVDFNLNFKSFAPSIEGVKNFITFATHVQPQRNINILFVSSIGATSNWSSSAPTSRAKIPECEIKDWKVARTGYGQSKLVSERLLAHAAREFGLGVTVVRVGQLGGPVKEGGKWTEREWVPSLIRSSMALGALPRELGPVDEVDWAPVDTAARILGEITERLAKRGAEEEAEFFHVVNPKTISWTALVPAMQQHMASGVQLVSFVEWVQLLKQSATTGDFQGVDEGTNPAAKLLDFFENLQDKATRFPKSKSTQLETKRTAKVSRTLRELGAVTPEWMGLWMRQWNWAATTETS